MSQSSPNPSVAELVERCRKGEQDAATTLFRIHVDKLTAMVRSRLSDKMNSRMDAEDVMQSAYRSFFRGIEDGRYTVEGPDELWRLLAAISLHKLFRRVAYHNAQKRSVKREQPAVEDDSLYGIQPEVVAQAPTPAEAAGIIEEVEYLMNRLTAQQRAMLELRLCGYSVEEIAVQVNRSDRTVRRLLEKLRDELERRLEDSRGE